MSRYVKTNALNYKLSVTDEGKIIFSTVSDDVIMTGALEIVSPTNTITFSDDIQSSTTTGAVNLFTTTTNIIEIGGDEITDGEGTTYLGISPTDEAIGREVVTAEWVNRNFIGGSETKSVILSTVDQNEVIDPGFDWGRYRAASYFMHINNFIDANEKAVNTQVAEVLVSCNSPLHVSVSMEDSVSDIITVDSTQGLYPGMTVEVVGCLAANR